MAILMCSSEEKDLFSSSTPRATIDPTRKHRISEDYVGASKEEIRKVVKIQEELDIDVLVHVEPEVGPGVACTREFLSWDLVVVVVVSSNGGAPPCFWHRRDGGVVARHVRVGSNDCLLGCHYLGRVLDLQLLRSLILWRARRVIDEAAWSKLVAWIS